MKRMIWIGPLLASLLYAPAIGQSPADGETAGTDLVAMSEDIEIMERILNKALARHFGRIEKRYAELAPENVAPTSDEPDDTWRATAFYRLATTNYQKSFLRSANLKVEGFYVPGTGVFFTLDLPTKLEEVDPPVEQEKTDEDLWKETEGELHRGAASALFSRQSNKKKQTRYILDQADLKRHSDVLLETIGKYGTRIEQLSTGDSIVLAVRIKAKAPPRPKTDLTAAYNLALLQSSWAGGRPHRLVMRIPISAIRNYQRSQEAGRAGLSDLRKATEIVHYRASASGRTVTWASPFYVETSTGRQTSR